jgi:hypothetical protein
MLCIIPKVVPNVVLGFYSVSVWMIPIVRLSLVFGSYMLADDCVQGGTLIVLAWSRLEHERLRGEGRNRVMMSGG